ncbi:hypothetical protein ACH37Y_19645 [Sphingomonas paucimobilis]
MALTNPIGPLPKVVSEVEPEVSAVFGHVRVDPDDQQTAIREGKAAQQAAREILALPDVQFDIVDASSSSERWGSLSASGKPTYVWQFRKGADGRSIPPPAYLLRHEIGHDLFVRYLVPSTRADQYGGDAPDWLDEMAAVAFEGEELRLVRRRAAVRYVKEKALIPLQRFLTMTHPEMAAKSIPVSPDGTMRVFEAVSDETPKFYAMASAFYDFLVTRTGNPAIVAELATAVRRGQPIERWLLTRIGHDKESDGIQALNADFLAWIATDPRYGGGSSQ